MPTSTEGPEAPSIYRVPATVEDMRPPPPSSIITEAANFLRAHWDEVLPFYQSMSGERPSMTGKFDGDEWKATFEMQRIASENGYAHIGSMQSNAFRRAVRFGYRRNTGVPMRLLAKQYRQLQITHQPPSQTQ